MKDIMEIIARRSNHTLDNMIRAGDPNAEIAFRELDGRAFVGNPGAQERIQRIDKGIKSGQIPSPLVQGIKKDSQGARLTGFLAPRKATRRPQYLPPDRDPFD